MIVFPAIDIKDGKCVRLCQGRKDSQSVYYSQPSAAARLFEDEGAEFLHVVDLDGAFNGNRTNLQAVKDIVREVSIPVQLGGGIRSMEDIEELMNAGVYRVILGTAAMENQSFVRNAINEYGDRVVVSIDASNGYAAARGWTQVSSIKALDLADMLQSMGLKTIVYTDISRDGMMAGPNIKALKELSKRIDMDIIASGGVASSQDVMRIKAMELYGVIIGKALYTGSISLRSLLEVV